MKTKWNIDSAHSGINFSIRHMLEAGGVLIGEKVQIELDIQAVKAAAAQAA